MITFYGVVLRKILFFLAIQVDIGQFFWPLMNPIQSDILYSDEIFITFSIALSGRYFSRD